jgi:hypothetical protein
VCACSCAFSCACVCVHLICKYVHSVCLFNMHQLASSNSIHLSFVNARSSSDIFFPFFDMHNRMIYTEKMSIFLCPDMQCHLKSLLSLCVLIPDSEFQWKPGVKIFNVLCARLFRMKVLFSSYVLAKKALSYEK